MENNTLEINKESLLSLIRRTNSKYIELFINPFHKINFSHEELIELSKNIEYSHFYIHIMSHKNIKVIDIAIDLLEN